MQKTPTESTIDQMLTEHKILVAQSAKAEAVTVVKDEKDIMSMVFGYFAAAEGGSGFAGDEAAALNSDKSYQL